MTINDQYYELCDIYVTIGRTVSLARAQNERPVWLKRQLFFQSLPKTDQLHYIRDFDAWLPDILAQQPLDKIDEKKERLMNLLPGIANFVRTTRAESYVERRDGNWHIWWANECESMRQQGKTVPGSDLDAERLLLDHFIQYETLGEPIRPFLSRPCDPNAPLPPISEVLHPYHPPRYVPVFQFETPQRILRPGDPDA
ncbi:hypothetical protein F4819DRAFT_466599 [Hypoxylon fuscum]|nr:hypothetical protein F4819DRAFT_466599 [Hypoxylon fuscum]